MSNIGQVSRADHASETYMGEAFWRQRAVLATMRPRLETLFSTLRAHMPAGHPGDLSKGDWVKLVTLALEFKPEKIIEVGRCYGNSTIALTEAANRLGMREKAFTSICLTNWAASASAIARVVPSDWFMPQDLLIENVCHTDFATLLGDSERVLIVWDAHGFDVAQTLLGTLLPLLENRQHVVIIHDIGDIRYHPHENAYAGYGIWKGEILWPGPTLRLGNVFGAVSEIIPLVDFVTRNALNLFSVEHSTRLVFDGDESKLQRMRAELGDSMFDRASGYHWLTLNESRGPFTFPILSK